MVVIRSVLQWRVAEIVPRVDPRSGFDEDRGDLEIAVYRRGMEAGALAVRFGLVGAVAARQ